MPLTYVTQWTTINKGVSNTITSAPQSFVAGELVTRLMINFWSRPEPCA